MWIWVDTNPEVCHQRMIDRASDRDMWKLNHWDEYILGVNFNPPLSLKLENQPDSLLIFHNSSDEEFEESMKTIVPSWKPLWPTVWRSRAPGIDTVCFLFPLCRFGMMGFFICCLKLL